MYMSTTVGVAELRQNLSQYLQRVANGERLVVTDRNRPVAELGPLRRLVPRLTASSPRGALPRPGGVGFPGRSNSVATPRP